MRSHLLNSDSGFPVPFSSYRILRLSSERIKVQCRWMGREIVSRRGRPKKGRWWDGGVLRAPAIPIEMVWSLWVERHSWKLDGMSWSGIVLNSTLHCCSLDLWKSWQWISTAPLKSGRPFVDFSTTHDSWYWLYWPGYKALIFLIGTKKRACCARLLKSLINPLICSVLNHFL